MVRILVRDLWRRSREEYLLGFVVLMLVWLWAEEGKADRLLAMAATLCGVAMLGPLLAFSRLAPKEVLLQPVSRREVWLARWVVATLAATLWVTSAHLTAVVLVWLGHGGPPDVAAVALTAICTFAYGGALMSLLPAVALAGRVALLRRIRWASRVLPIAAIILFAGGVIWPAVFYDRLPTAWSDTRGGAGIALVIGLGLGLAGLRHRPAIRAYAISLAQAPPAAHASRWVPMLTDSFTGLPKLVWLDATRLSAGLVSMVTILAGTWVVGDLVTGSEASVASAVIKMGLLPFDGGPRNYTMALFLGVAMLNLRDVDAIPHRTDLLQASLRFWRTLPWSRDAIAVLITARRLMGWLLLWAMLLAIQFALIGPPSAFRLDLLSLAAGADALAFASAFRWRRRSSLPGQMAVVGVITMALVLSLRESQIPEPLAFYAVGLAALGLSVVIHRSTLSRSETFLLVNGGSRATSGDMALAG